MPAAKGYATVSGEKGYIKVDAHFDKLAPPTQFGPEYLTYVLWAITPEGRATNLGEVQRDDEDARVQVTTELQAFGLVLTAEPYFAVTQPSDVVVMENVVRDNTKGNVETIQAKYELLKRGSYLMNQDAARLKIKPLEPGAPLDLAQARNAVELARWRVPTVTRQTPSPRPRRCWPPPSRRVRSGASSNDDHDAGAPGGADGRGRAPRGVAAAGGGARGRAAAPRRRS